MTTLQQDLRALVAAHGFEMVHTTLQEMMRQDYEFLSKIFKTDVLSIAVAPVPAPATALAHTPSPAPAPAPTTVHTSLEIVQAMNPPAKKMVKITVRKAAEEPLASPPPAPMPPTPAPISQPEVNTLEAPAEKSKFRSPAEVKRFQKEAESKKRAELDAKGITVASLMTRDNLKKWIEDEGHTFAWVAREMIGCADTLVSTMAKNYGIQSNISKKRGIIMART
jgi:type IV secretory pathway VirB10-like protein